MQVGDGARIQGWVFRPHPWSMCDEGIGGSKNGAQMMVTVELETPAVFLGGIGMEGAALGPGLQELGEGISV